MGRTFVVIIAAAGRGRRFGAGVNKLFVDLDGAPILARTLAAWQEMADGRVERIVVALAGEDERRFERHVRPLLAPEPPVVVVRGGAERQDSIARALAAVPDAAWIAVHDGARPLIDRATVDRVWEAAQRCGAAIAAVPVTQTVKRVDAQARIAATVPREDLWLAQTPQIFAGNLLRRAYAEAARLGITATDDAMLVERLGEPVQVVPGDDANLKITTQTDLIIAQALRRQRRSREGRQA